MSRLRKTHYTLVQHSAFIARGDETFRNAVEPASISTHAELGKVVDAGGQLFDSHSKAEDAADEVSQPHMDRILFPDQVTADANSAALTFDADLTIGGRALYVPTNGVTAG
ncbi:hypothetical protein [Streptomyces sp. NPDC017260]|uniref:hypothetical protein n=1 Tax=unclassified Streptomyces TaxID=2593676 RepID=UPI0037B85984